MNTKDTNLFEKKAQAPRERTPGSILYKELGYQVQGALHSVYHALGPGFREETYRRATMKALRDRGIPFETERTFGVVYEGELVDEYRLDLVVDGKIVLELKAVDELNPRFEAQLLSYLKASGLRLGLLVNLGSSNLQIIRRVL